jgi:hypothetical protein
MEAWAREGIRTGRLKTVKWVGLSFSCLQYACLLSPLASLRLCVEFAFPCGCAALGISRVFAATPFLTTR